MKRVCAVVLSLVFLLIVVLPSNKAEAESIIEYQAGDVVTFGSYPQTQVTDEALISALNGISKTWKSYPYYSKNTGADASVRRSALNESMMKFADITYENERYRAVKILQYRPQSVVMEPGEGSRQDERFSLNVVYYFKWEPIEWIVLDPTKGLLLARNILDTQPFNSVTYRSTGTEYRISYSTSVDANEFLYSTIFEWLNISGSTSTSHYSWAPDFNFINSAFSEEERTAILTTKLKDKRNEASTPSKVFLLSKDEHDQYKSVIAGSLGMDVTGYASSQGLILDKTKEAAWYLRTAYETATNGYVYYVVGSNSRFFEFDLSDIGSSWTGTRPAVRVDLSSESVQRAFQVSKVGLYGAAPGAVRMTWDALHGVSSYEVYRCDSTKDPSVSSNWISTPVGTVTSDSTPIFFRDNSAVPERSYYYRVKAISGNGSIWSNTVLLDCTLANPTVSGSNDVNGAPKLIWNAVSGADSYEVYRKEDGKNESMTMISTCGINDRSFTDETAPKERSYTYWVKAKSSVDSKYDSFRSLGTYLGQLVTIDVKLPQSKITSLSIQNGHPVVRWEPVAGASRYLVEVKQTQNSQWVKLADTTGLTVTHGGAVSGKSLDYRVTAVSSRGEKYNSLPSGTKTIVVSSATVSITAQPKDTSVAVGATASFAVSVSGTGVTYRWQAYNPNTKKWVDSSSASAKTANLTVTAQAGHNGFKFRCVVKDGNGKETTSAAATLTVKPAITTQPKAKTVPVGGTAEFTIAAKGAGTLKYQWQAYNPNTKQWVNSSSASAKTSTLSITAQTGHHGFKFRCIVTDGNGNSTTSNAALLTVRPGIVAQPKDVSVSVGGTVKLTVSAKSVGTLSYQWQVWDTATETWKNSLAASAKTANFTFTAQKGHNGKKFRCVLTDSNGNQTVTRGALVTVK